MGYRHFTPGVLLRYSQGACITAGMTAFIHFGEPILFYDIFDLTRKRDNEISGRISALFNFSFSVYTGIYHTGRNNVSAIYQYRMFKYSAYFV